MPKTSLYRHFDAEGRLLYVGVALRFGRRLKSHQCESSWYCDIARIDIEHHPSRGHALFAEAVAIRDEAPLYNRGKPIPVEPLEIENLVEEPVAAKIASTPSKQVKFWAPFANEGGERVVAYTILPDGTNAQSVLDQFAERIQGVSGFIEADIENPGSGRLCAARMALGAGLPLMTDRPELFDDCAVYGLVIKSGDDISELLAKVASEQNVTNVKACKRRKRKKQH